MKGPFIFFVTLFVGIFSSLSAQTPGELDVSFDAGSELGINGTVSSAVVIGDGKVYVGGVFTTVRGVMRSGIARLNADKSLDTGFDPGSGTAVAPGSGEYPQVLSVAVQSDGKVLIGGAFTFYNGVARDRIARLNGDGSLDTSFTPGSGANGNVYSVAIQPDGKVLIGGEFTSYNGVARNRIARLNADGSLDTTFASGSGANNRVRSVLVQEDGKVLMGGSFTSYNGVARSSIARLNANGSLDTGFVPGSGTDGSISSVAVQADGKVLIGGSYTTYNGVLRNNIARLNGDGSLDTNFSPGSGTNSEVRSVAVQLDGKMLIGGFFTSYDGVERARIARLDTDGTLDIGFDPGSVASQAVQTIAVQGDGKVVIGASFGGLVRFNVDGSLDTSFTPGRSGANAPVFSMAVQADGKVLIGGFFSSFDGVARNRIARLNANGTLDMDFDPGSGASYFVSSIAVQADGKVLVAGGFNTYNGVVRNGIARLNANGSLDTSFDPGSGSDGWEINSVAVQTDGKVLIGGLFSSFNGVARGRIARLNANGSLDTSFAPGAGANDGVHSVAVQDDGKVLIGGGAEFITTGVIDGGFTSYNGVPRNRIARLNVNGSLDTTFNPGTGANGEVRSMALQADGKVLISGAFTSYNGVVRNGIARLNADGSLDTGFDPGSGAEGSSGWVTSVAMHADGRVMIGGEFTSYSGVSRKNLARTYNAPATQSLSAVGNSEIFWARGGSVPEVDRVIFHLSTDNGLNWAELGAGSRVPGGWSLSGLALPPQKLLRARGFTAGGGMVESIATGGPAPIVTSVGSGTIPGLDAQQWITIRGTGFASGAQVQLFDGTTSFLIPPERTVWRSDTEIRILANLTAVPAQWTAQVVNPGGLASIPLAFQVNPPVVRPLEGMDFGTVAPGDVSERTFTVRNGGNSPAALAASHTSLFGPFEFAGGPYGDLAPGAEQEVVLRFAPTAPGSYSASVTFRLGDESVVRSLTGRSVESFTGGTATITGRVVQDVGGSKVPVRDSLVHLVRMVDGQRVATGLDRRTGPAGEFSMERVPAGDYLLVAHRPARAKFLEDESQSIEVPEGATLDFQLELPASEGRDPTSPENIPVVLVRGRGEAGVGESAYWAELRDHLRPEFHNVWDPNEFWDFSTSINGQNGIQSNADRLHDYILSKVAFYKLQHGVSPPRIHLVAHSMGGLIVRQMLQKYSLSEQLPPIGDVFMLSTPNAGTVLADFGEPLAFWEREWQTNRDLKTEHVRRTFRNVPWPDREGMRLFLAGGTRPGTEGKYIAGSIIINQNSPIADLANDGAVTLLSSRGYYYPNYPDGLSGISLLEFIRSLFPPSSSFPKAHAYLPLQSVPLNHTEIIQNDGMLDWIKGILRGRLPGPISIVASEASAPMIGATAAFGEALNSEPEPQIPPVVVDARSFIVEGGGSSVHEVPMETVPRADFTVSYSNPSVVVRLIEPGGAVIDSASSVGNPLITFESLNNENGGMVSVSITDPTPGHWQVVADGTSAATDVAVSLHVSCLSNLKLIAIQPERIGANAPVPLIAKAIVDKGEELSVLTPVPGATVTGAMIAPDGVTSPLALADDGTQGEGAADDGTHGLIFTNGGGAGDYELLYVANGVHPVTGEPFRRVARGSFTRAAPGGFVAEILSHAAVDSDDNGYPDTLMLETRVEVAAAGDYTLSGRLLAEGHLEAITGVADFSVEQAGSAAVTILFTPHELPEGQDIGPFALDELLLFRRGSETALLDVFAGSHDFPVTLHNELSRRIRLSGDLNFGEVTVGESSQRTLTIHNDSWATFSVGGLALPPGFSAAYEGRVDPGDAVEVNVVFAPTEEKTYQGEVVADSDAFAGSDRLTLSGTGNAPLEQHILTEESRPRRVSDGPFSLGASSTSGLPLNYEVLAGPVTVDASGLVTPTGADGAVTIRISQPGGSGYQPAPDVYVTFSIGSWHPFTKLVAGGVTYALRADGTLWTWGYANNTGHLADATIGGTGRVVPQQIGTASDWTDLTIGSNFGFGMRAGGALWAWGANLNGQLGDGTTTVRAAPVQIGSERAWANVSAGTSHTAAVAADGTLWTWGLNTNGQLGHGDTVQRTSPTQVGSATDWSRVACGSSFTWAIKTNGELWAWGANGIGQLGVGDTVQRTSPTRVGTATDWAQIAVGSNYALGLKTDGTLWAWGTNGIGQFGNGGTVSSQVPVKIGSASDWSSVSACFATSTSAARKTDGSVWVWGLNSSGQLGDGTTINRNTPQRFSPGNDWAGIQVGQFHVTAWRADGTVWVAGEGRGFSGASPRALTRAGASAQTWLQLTGNGTHFHAVRADGTLWAWGRNNEGAFGNGSLLDAAILTQIGTEDQWEQIASGGQTISAGSFTLAIKKDGTLWSTGSNTNSKLGLGDTTTRTSFTQIGVATNWMRAAAGSSHGMAVRTDGSLWGWGLNATGQLGLGDTTARTTPTQVGAATDWQTVACGASHSMGIKTNGTLWAWGLNGNGRLGLGDTTQRTTPTQVGSDNDWIAVACGSSHTLALKNDGTLWVWGLNSSGQLGLGNTAQRISPVQVGTATNWTSISASINSSAALTADGTLWTAGESLAGQVGLGSTVNVLAFTPAGAANLQHVAMGAVSLAAIQADGSFWTAGTAGPQVLGGGRDRTAVVPIQPQLTPQSIVPPPPRSQSVRVTATSGLPVSLLLLSGSAEIDGDEITLTGPPGSTVTVLAWQHGDERAWNAAPPVQLSLTRPVGNIGVFAGTAEGTELTSGESTVDFGTATLGAAPVTRLFTIRNDGDDTLNLGEVVATGDWSIDSADMAGTLAPGATTSFKATFAPAFLGPRTGGVTITSDDPDEAEFIVLFTGRGMQVQNIGFDVIVDQLANATINLTATGGGSGNPVTFTAEGPASIDGNNVLSFTGTGSVTVRANQAGNADYHAAPEVAHTFDVSAAGATVTLTNTIQVYNGSPRSVTVTTSPPGLAHSVTYVGQPGPPTNAGIYGVNVNVTDPRYTGFGGADLIIQKASQTIDFPLIADTVETATLNLSATGGGSGNAVTFAISSGPAYFSGPNQVRFSGPGSVTLTASQAGNSNYHAATPVPRTFQVDDSTATVTISKLLQVADGTPRPVVVTTDPPGLEVEVTYDGNATPPSAAGTYAVVATVDDPLYEGSAEETLVIDHPGVLILVPGGTLPAGSNLGPLDQPTFQIGRYEVTWGFWKTVRDWGAVNGYDLAGRGIGCADGHPVRQVTWFDAVKWCNARTEWENATLGRSLAPVYAVAGATFRSGEPDPATVVADETAGGYRLPSAAEWEFAARGGDDGTDYPYPGGTDLPVLAWFRDNSAGAACPISGGRGTWPVGGKLPNELGLYDLAGNVAEWTGTELSGVPIARYFRGGAWDLNAQSCQISLLLDERVDDTNSLLGFRVARSIATALPVALDNIEVEWDSSGAQPWFAQSGTTYDGSDAAESGEIHPGEESRLETEFAGPGNLSFRWKAASVEGADTVELRLGHSGLEGSLTGSTEWEAVNLEIPDGNWPVEWIFSRHPQSPAGSSRVWVDEVVYQSAGPPEVTTANPTDLTGTSATLGGQVTSDGGRAITARGVVYGTSPDPALGIASDLSAPTAGTGSFTVSATGLLEGTTYYARAYATNNLGTSYGDNIVFTTNTTVAFTDDVATYNRSILPGDRQVFDLTLSGPRIVSFSTTGGAALRAELRDAAGKVIAVFEGDTDFDLDELLYAGGYSLHIFRQPDGGPAQSYVLTLDASVVAATRPDVAVGVSAGALTGVGLYSPASQLAAMTSRKLRAVTAYASVANRGNLPDVLTVSGGRGSVFFKVDWYGPTGGNITAAMNIGTYRTAEMEEGSAPVSLSTKITPNKKKLTKKNRKTRRVTIVKKTFVLSLRATSTFAPATSDAATIQVKTK